MKYRRLSEDELKEMESEFIKFLASNGIPGDEWQAVISNDPDRMNELLDQFSDMVLDRALSNIKFIEHLSDKNIKSFYCLPDRIIMIGIDINEKDDMVFTDPASLKKLVDRSSESLPLKIFKSEKKYDGNREEEIYEMLKKGCQIISKERFEALLSLHNDLKAQKN